VLKRLAKKNQGPPMSDAIAVINAGSSSLKFSLFVTRGVALELEMRGQLEALYTAPRFVARSAEGRVLAEKSWGDGVRLGHEGALDHLINYARSELGMHRLAGVGHRIVHGGLEFSHPVRLDMEVLQRLEQFVPLAPLHQPHNLAPVRRLLAQLPQLTQVACFDTSFHRDNAELTQMFGLPYELFEQGVRRYGFHGLSYEFIASVLPALDARAIEDLLYNKSGLLGVSGVSGDMRTLLASDAPRAKLAIDLYCYRIGRELGSLAAAVGGLDALVFTAGIGENAAPIRAAVCSAAEWLGIELDAAANARGGPRISTIASRTAAWVVPTDEELMIARHTRRLLVA
jgi:acetate kinase